MSISLTVSVTPTRSHFGEKLRAELDRKQLSIRKLARMMAPANPEPMRRNLARWIGGYNQPSRIHRVMIADALGVPLETFEEDDEESDPVTLDEFLRLRVLDAMRKGGRAVLLELLEEELRP